RSDRDWSSDVCSSDLDKVQIEQKVSENQTIWANKNKLIQVCVNLLQNAIDALASKPEGGEKPTIWIEGREENGKSLLVFRDNGRSEERRVGKEGRCRW